MSNPVAVREPPGSGGTLKLRHPTDGGKQDHTRAHHDGPDGMGEEGFEPPTPCV